MRSVRTALILVVLASLALVAMQRLGLAQAASNLRIVSPESGQKVTQNVVEVRFQLVNPAVSASSSPTFRLQLDGNDPVDTTADSYTFTGLKPGEHTVLVEAVDANGTPLVNCVNAVRFNVLGQPTPPATPRAQAGQPKLVNAAEQSKEPLPGAGSALPLLSIIGFGVLLGGIVSALKTR